MTKRQLRYGWGGWIRTNDHGIKTRAVFIAKDDELQRLIRECYPIYLQRITVTCPTPEIQYDFKDKLHNFLSFIEKSLYPKRQI